jgi:metal-responsive CopG/Arc/MetJ family transcriptional regulator
MSEKKGTRITINLTPDLDERLDKIAEAMGSSKVDVFRDALRLLEYLVERERDGYELLERKDDVLTPARIFERATLPLSP